MIERIEEPDFSRWPSLLKSNLLRAEAIGAALGKGKVGAARTALREEVTRFEKEISAVATSLGFTWKEPNIPSAGPIVMSGHQPVVYHPGLLQKLHFLSALEFPEPITRINVILDTDEGSAGDVVFPSGSQNGPRLAVSSFAVGGPLFANQVVKGSAEVREVFSELLERLDSHLDSAVIEKFRKAGEILTRLGGTSVLFAQSILRAQFGAREYGEVPYSWLLRRPEISSLATLPLEQIDGFAVAYNESLTQHRESRKIDNPANPFPNLAVEGTSWEAPLWLLDTKEATRARLTVTKADGEIKISAGPELVWHIDKANVCNCPAKIDPRFLIAPRGGWISALFRIALSDLFIHGLGGGKYDEFTSAFINRWLGVSAPDFVVASCTRYVYETEVSKYATALEYKSKFKDLVSHTESHLGKNLFGAEAESKLEPLARRRGELLAALKAQQGGSSEVKYELNDLNKKIRGIIEQSELPKLMALAETPEVVVNAWKCRTYPFFAFD